MIASDTASRNAILTRYVLIDRLDDTIFGEAEATTPLRALRAIEATCTDLGGERYRRVSRRHPDAAYDAFTITEPLPPRASLSDLERIGTYVTTFRCVPPRCVLCTRVLTYHLWEYGEDATPIATGRCCEDCYNTRVRCRAV